MLDFQFILNPAIECKITVSTLEILIRINKIPKKSLIAEFTSTSLARWKLSSRVDFSYKGDAKAFSIKKHTTLKCPTTWLKHMLLPFVFLRKKMQFHS